MSSKVDKSQVVAGAGWLSAVFIALAKKVHALGGSDEDIHRLATPAGEPLLEEFAEMIVRGFLQSLKITVDYTQTLQEMIEKGKYDWVNSNIIQKNFPIRGEGKEEVRIKLFHFDCVISSRDAIAEMDRQGFRPATLPELLALGAVKPELQKEFFIVAFGSRWQFPPGGILNVPVLSWNAQERRLRLDWFGGNWREHCRFAGVCK